jgi:hypothetical protein
MSSSGQEIGEMTDDCLDATQLRWKPRGDETDIHDIERRILGCLLVYQLGR